MANLSMELIPQDIFRVQNSKSWVSEHFYYSLYLSLYTRYLYNVECWYHTDHLNIHKLFKITDSLPNFPFPLQPSAQLA